MDLLLWLQNWYINNCDGIWEHMYGVKIYNVDNPGWAIEIDLINTKLENKPFTKKQYDNGDEDWLLCYVKNGVFHGDGSSNKLIEILNVFKDWVEN